MVLPSPVIYRDYCYYRYSLLVCLPRLGVWSLGLWRVRSNWAQGLAGLKKFRLQRIVLDRLAAWALSGVLRLRVQAS